MNAPRAVLTERQLRLTVDDYLLLDREGALAAYPKTELIDGVILPVNAQYVPHAYAKMELANRLREALLALGSDLYVIAEVSVAMPPHGMPQPDIVLARSTRAQGALPVVAVALIAEISASTLDIDLGPKPVMYAAAGVPEYWVIDLEGRRAHRMWSPGPDGYARSEPSPLSERLASVTVDGLKVETAGLV